MMWFLFKCNNLGLVPPPELAEHLSAKSKQPRFDIRCRIVPDRLVCRIIADADSDYPRDPDKQNAVHPKPRQLAAHHDFRGDHVSRDVVAVFADRSVAGVCSPTRALLAPVADNTPALCRAHTVGEDVAGS